MRMNSVTLVGRAGSDPVARYFESGSVQVVLDLLVNRRSQQDAPDAFSLELWGKQAQIAADHVRKGCLIGIIGSVKRSPSDSIEGSHVYIRVDRLELLGPPLAVKVELEGSNG